MFLLSIEHWLYYKLKSLQTAEFPADMKTFFGRLMLKIMPEYWLKVYKKPKLKR